MKVIIAGGRDWELSLGDFRFLDGLRSGLALCGDPIEMVISGGATGVDTDGELWAEKYSIPIRRFHPKWDEQGLAAGPLRNQAMAECAGQDGH